MITLRDRMTRGRTNTGWLDSRHSFSFGSHYDPTHMGYRSLRVDIPGRPELTVRTRKGVTVGPGARPAYAGAPAPNP